MNGMTTEDEQAEREATAMKRSFRSTFPKGGHASRGHGKRQLDDPGARLKDRRGAHLPQDKPVVLPDFVRRLLNGPPAAK